MQSLSVTEVKQLDDVWASLSRSPSDVESEQVVPIAFFDELSAEVKTALSRGWLKFFLGPLEDGWTMNW